MLGLGWDVWFFFFVFCLGPAIATFVHVGRVKRAQEGGKE